jgi:hypothetical protein
MTWHHLNYLLGLHDLGHEVWFLEDSGSFSYPYNPATWTVSEDPAYGIEYLKKNLSDFGLPPNWCYYSEFQDRHYGLTQSELNDLLARADLLICVSGVTPIRPERPRPRRMAVIDTDPVFTQLRMRHDENFAGYYRQFDSVATFGRLIGTSSCPLPTHGLNWIPTNQPVSIRRWPVTPATARAFTTIGKWEHTSDRHLEFQGQRYLSSKGVEWMKMLDLPRQVPWDMTMGMLAVPTEIAAQFKAHGWKLLNPEQATLSCQAFADFIHDSAGEFTVTKEIYAGLPSGWFSDRSAAYLASGRPVVTQASGFDQWLPTGAGLFSFRTMQEAVDALCAIASNYHTHAQAARQIAEEYFDAKKVLAELLENVL